MHVIISDLFLGPEAGRLLAETVNNRGKLGEEQGEEEVYISLHLQQASRAAEETSDLLATQLCGRASSAKASGEAKAS